jgi:hypothetical protein
MVKRCLVMVAAGLLTLTAEVKAADAPDISSWVQFSSFSYAGKKALTPKPDESLNPITAGGFQGVMPGMFARLDPANSMPPNVSQ